jgi:hypothetical protein
MAPREQNALVADEQAARTAFDPVPKSGPFNAVTRARVSSPYRFLACIHARPYRAHTDASTCRLPQRCPRPNTPLAFASDDHLGPGSLNEPSAPDRFEVDRNGLAYRAFP